MLLGYNTNGFASHGLTEALDVIAGLGYRSVGITLDHGSLNPFAPNAAAELAACRDQVARLGLAVVIETGARFLLDPWRKHQPTLLSADGADRDRRAAFLRQAVDVASELGSGVVSLWSGAAADSNAPELDERLAGELRSLCGYAEGKGVVIGFEPEPGMYIESMADFDRIDALVSHRAFQLTLDIGHAHLTEPDAAACVREYAGRTVNMHIEGMQRPHHDHLVPWEGDLDVRAVLAAVRETGYAGPATLELSRHSHAAVDVARRAIAFLK